MGLFRGHGVYPPEGETAQTPLGEGVRRVVSKIKRHKRKYLTRKRLTREYFNAIIILQEVFNMNGREIIKDIMAKLTISNATLANRLGITQAALWDRIDTQPRKGKPRKDIPVSLLSEMVKVMDYKVVVVPVSTRVPADGYVIGELESTS